MMCSVRGHRANVTRYTLHTTLLFLLLRFVRRPQRELRFGCFAVAAMAHAFDFLAKRIDVLKGAIDGGEADVRNFIETVQLFHRELPDESRGDFAFAERAELVADVSDGPVQRLARH